MFYQRTTDLMDIIKSGLTFFLLPNMKVKCLVRAVTVILLRMHSNRSYFLSWNIYCSTVWFSFPIHIWSQTRLNTRQIEADVMMTWSVIEAGGVYVTGSYYSIRLFLWISPCAHFFLEKNCKLINNELCSFSLFPPERLMGRRMSLFLFTFPTSLFFPLYALQRQPTLAAFTRLPEIPGAQHGKVQSDATEPRSENGT